MLGFTHTGDPAYARGGGGVFSNCPVRNDHSYVQRFELLGAWSSY